jgi:hypothetical protein
MADNLSNEVKDFIIHAYPMVKCDNPDCGKEFCRPTREWGYRIPYKSRTLTFCSYSCMRVIEKKKMAEEAAAKKLKKTKKRGFIRGKK